MKMIFASPDGDGPPVEAGSTATCVLARRDKLVVANVGDR